MLDFTYLENNRRHYGFTLTGEDVHSKLKGFTCHVEHHTAVHGHFAIASKLIDASDLKPGETKAYTVDLGINYAQLERVETDSSTVVFFDFRDDCLGRSRLVTGFECKPTSLMTIALYRHPKENILVAMTAYPGPFAPLEPWDPTSKGREQECIEFWSKNAIVVKKRPETALDDDPTFWIRKEPVKK